MIKRTLAKKLHQAAKNFPVVTVTGPRQSGKTTLVRAEFKDYDYVSLELPDQRAFLEIVRERAGRLWRARRGEGGAGAGDGAAGGLKRRLTTRSPIPVGSRQS